MVVRGDVERLGLVEGHGDSSRVRTVQQADLNVVNSPANGTDHKAQVVEDHVVGRVHQDDQVVTLAGFALAARIAKNPGGPESPVPPHHFKGRLDHIRRVVGL